MIQLLTEVVHSSVLKLASDKLAFVQPEKCLQLPDIRRLLVIFVDKLVHLFSELLSLEAVLWVPVSHKYGNFSVFIVVVGMLT